MKKKLFSLLLILPWCMSCTHNNGDIGPLFGTWKLNVITIDNEPDAVYESNANQVWKFQSSVIEMQEIKPHHETDDHFGTWRLTSGNTMEMTFTYRDDDHPDGEPLYCPPKSSHLPSGVFIMHIIQMTSDHLKLQYTADDGTSYSYSLEKW